MAAFGIRFLLCSLLLAVPVLILLAAKRLLDSLLTGRMQYRLWFVLLPLLALPFAPAPLLLMLRQAGDFVLSGSLVHFLADVLAGALPDSLSQVLTGSLSEGSIPGSQSGTGAGFPGTAVRIRDLAVSVSRGIPSSVGILFLAVWLAGSAAMLTVTAKKLLRLHRLESSALLLQDPGIRKLYRLCVKETGLKREIPLYSTAFLTSPFTARLLSPRIYLPIRLVSDCPPAKLRYILLHELQHCRRRDALAGYLMSLAAILYWFHPLVRYALREMRTDREVACDSDVLGLLEKSEYIDYGKTLIDLARSISMSRPRHGSPLSCPFAAGARGGLGQLQRRIRHIAGFRPASPLRQTGGRVACGTVVLVLSLYSPLLLVQGAATGPQLPAQDGCKRFVWTADGETVRQVDLSGRFGGHDGCFVLWEPDRGIWTVYNREFAETRVSPDSTYKVYSALAALENGVITPRQSRMPWDGQPYPIDEWNEDQDLPSAMENSVNWYFQQLDRQTGAAALGDFLERTGYGNQDISGGLSRFWLESSLKISPVEQVKLLQGLDSNIFGFAPEHVEAVKAALLLHAAPDGSFYGKTGSGRVNGHGQNGWFIGFARHSGRTFYFAVNLRGEDGASGAAAAEIAMDILEGFGLSPYAS